MPFRKYLISLFVRPLVRSERLDFIEHKVAAVKLPITASALGIPARNIGSEVKCYIVKDDRNTVFGEYNVLFDKMRTLLMSELYALKRMFR